MGNNKAFVSRERVPELADATRGVGARLITRMLRDLGRERGLVIDDIVWLPDPENWHVQAYVLAVTWGGRTRRQVFPREYLDSVTESDTVRRCTIGALKSLLGTPLRFGERGALRVRFAGVLIALLCLWPGWGLANQSTCVAEGCTASATIAFKIVIPARPLSTRLRLAWVADGGMRKPADDIILLHGNVYVLSEDRRTHSYTIAKP